MRSRLSRRVFAPMLILSAVLLLVGITAAGYVFLLQRESSALLVWALQKTQLAEQIVEAENRQRLGLQLYRLSANPHPLGDVARHGEVILQWTGLLIRSGAAGEELTLLRRIESVQRQIQITVRSLPEASDRAETVRLLEPLPLDQEIWPGQEYLNFNQAQVLRAGEQHQKLADRVGFYLLALGFVGSMIGMLAGLRIARRVDRSIVGLSIPIRDAAGKLEEVVGPITVSGDGDANFEQMHEVLDQMSQQVGQVIEKLQQNQHVALKAERLAGLGQLAAGVAHELRNPLMSMKILVQSARRDGPDAALRDEDLEVLEEEITRLDKSIQAFLDYARPPKLEARRFDLLPVARQTLDLIGNRAASQGVTLRLKTEMTQTPVTADEGQVRQVLLNLLLNALDAMPGGGDVTLEIRSDRPGRLAIEVADEGPGLDPKIRCEMFEPFVSTKETGTGLGLPVSRRIARDHGGDIAARNRPEGGAVFIFTLPAEPPQPVSETPVETAAEKETKV